MTTEVSGAAKAGGPGVELTQDPAVTDETTAAPATGNDDAGESVTAPSKGGQPIKPDNWMNP